MKEEAASPEISFYKGDGYVMIALCRLFRSDGWRFCRGASLLNCVYVFRRTDGEPHSNAASERTFSMGNNIGKVLSVILSHG